MTRQIDLRQEYTSPEVEVFELSATDVLCASIPDGTETYNIEPWL